MDLQRSRRKERFMILIKTLENTISTIEMIRMDIKE
jgi:hypothetical protein